MGRLFAIELQALDYINPFGGSDLSFKIPIGFVGFFGELVVGLTFRHPNS